MAFSSSGFEVPARAWKAVVPSDNADLPPGCVGLYVGGAGDLSLVGVDGVAAVFKAVPVGSFVPVGPKRINATNTTATLILALYAGR